MLIKVITTIIVMYLGCGSSSVTPSERSGWHAQRHAHMNEVVQHLGEKARMIFVGDSITQGWEEAGANVWKEHFAPFHAINLGIGGDRTEHVLWRFEHGNLDGLSPDLALVMIGTNNFGQANPNTAAEVLEGVVAVVDALQSKLPHTQVILFDIFPRGAQFNHMRGSILQVNQALQKRYANNTSVTYLPIGHLLIEADGSIDKSIMPDFLHLSEKGYNIWAKIIHKKVKGSVATPP